nr:glutaredoxin [Candidatus Saccharicenans sp.]
MEMLNEEVRDFTRKKFAEELVNPVELIFFMEEKSPLIVPGQPVSTDCQYCPEIKQLLEELSSLSDKIKL